MQIAVGRNKVNMDRIWKQIWNEILKKNQVERKSHTTKFVQTKATNIANLPDIWQTFCA